MHRTPGPRTSAAAAPDSPLRGRVAVVTGAARGIGEALARRLSASGMRVALLGREAHTLHLAASSLPTPSLCVEADVTDQEALDEAARQVADRLGDASVVVANAGVAAGGPFRMTDADLWRRVVDVNLVGSANTARAFLPQLARTRGYFLQVASTAAFGSAPMMSAYCASKAGAESFAQALRGEVEPDGIAVGIAYLHWTGTDMINDIDDHPVLRALRTHQPWFARRVHSPDQVADWLTTGAERRAAHVYAPPWLRWCQPLRPLFPALVSHVARREMRRTPAADLAAGTGVMGAGGLADWEAYTTAVRGRTAPPSP
ncbi:SDR family oxidoreductase [Streptomyces sp. NPDC058735]|uniref:SDR family oxidoreductase n=1 Tax=unclassified Streptomyces TaxID=2593676 RepID=UPI0036AE88D7